MISHWLYGIKDTEKLTAEQKDTITAITRALGSGVGAAVGGNSANAMQGSLNADSAVENNNGAVRAIDKTKFLIIPAFGVLYCSLDERCTDSSGVFVGILNDLLEEDKRLEAENQKRIEQLKAFRGEAWILSLGNSDKKDISKPIVRNTTSVGSPLPDPDDENNGNIRVTHNSIKESPNYPKGFKDIQNGTKKFNINNRPLLDNLRKIESGDWKKVYRNGFDNNGNKVSIHYFQNTGTGKVFNVKVKNSWSQF